LPIVSPCDHHTRPHVKQGRAPSHFTLHVHTLHRGLITILLVGGLGIEDQENGLQGEPILAHIFYFCGYRPKTKCNFDVHGTVHRNYISIVKPTRCTNFSNLLYFGRTLYMFRSVFPSIIRSLKLYIQHQVYVKQILLPAC